MRQITIGDVTILPGTLAIMLAMALMPTLTERLGGREVSGSGSWGGRAATK